MKTTHAIYKYILSPGFSKVTMTVNARVLSVQFQGENLCLWAKVNSNPGLKTEERNFFTVATGQEFDSVGLNYVGTAQMLNNPLQPLTGTPTLVFHVFEKAK